MKNTILFAGAVLTAFVVAGCAAVTTNEGFPAPLGGSIYSDMSFGGMVQPTQERFTVVKRNVKASAKATSFFMAIAMGDVSYATLRSQALAAAPGADDLIDVKVDCKQKNILGINEVTVVLTATAVKFNK